MARSPLHRRVAELEAVHRPKQIRYFFQRADMTAEEWERTPEGMEALEARRSGNLAVVIVRWCDATDSHPRPPKLTKA